MPGQDVFHFLRKYLLATDIDLAGAKETVAQIEAAGGKAAASALDVTSEEEIRRFLHRVNLSVR